MQQRKAPDVNPTTGSLDSNHASAGVAGEKEAKVCVDSRLVRKGLLGNQVKPIINQSGAELLAGTAGRKFDIQTGGQSRNVGSLRLLAEIPFHSQIRVAHTVGGAGSSSAKDGKIRNIQVQFHMVWQAV